jgi:hypothetical protein
MLVHWLAPAEVTLMLAEAVLPVPPLVEVTFPVMLFFVPTVVPVTFTEKLHDPLAERVAPERLITFVPCVAVIVPPPQEPVSAFGDEIMRPDGNVSVKAIPVRVVALFWLLMEKVRLIEPARGMLVALNDLVMEGGDKRADCPLRMHRT